MITTNIISIGNSQGIRIPQSLIKQLNLKNEVVLSVEDNKLTVSPTQSRQGWSQSFVQNKNDKAEETLEINDHSWDENEWTW